MTTTQKITTTRCPTCKTNVRAVDGRRVLHLRTVNRPRLSPFTVTRSCPGSEVYDEAHNHVTFHAAD